MTSTDAKTNELEYDIQRFMQIREQIHEEIKKIGSHTTTLDETNKRLIAHFDVFKELSTNAEDHIHEAIEKASHDMAKTAAQEFSKMVHDSLSSELTNLNTIMRRARDVLEETMGEKYRKLVLFSFLGCLLCGFASFGGGYIYAKRTTYELPEDFFRGYARRVLMEENVKQEVQGKIKLRRRKPK